MRKSVIVALLALTAVLIGPASARAGDTICVGVLAGSHDNLIVPAGATCNIADATIQGSVKVFGALNVSSPTTIGGNIDGEPGHTFVRLFGGATLVVGGDVQLKKQGSVFSQGYLAGTQIRGDFQYEENVGFLVANGGQIGGDFKSEKNTGGGGIFGNTILGNLECKENTPEHEQAGNTVGGALKCPEK